jgi:transposase
MQQISTVGLDLAKNTFQVHGIDAAENVVVKKQVSRAKLIPFFEKLPPCLIGMEACATAHHWARQLKALGHDVRLMPAKDVKAYVKRGKNDAADAAAICEAVRRRAVRTVPVKTPEQQAALMPHRVRDLLVRQRTQLANALRAHLAELGVSAAEGLDGLRSLIAIVTNEHDRRLPDEARFVCQALAAQLDAIGWQIKALERRIQAWARANEDSRRLQAIPGIGFITAAATIATVPDPRVFKSGRDFAAWLGIVPRQDSTAGKPKLGPISKQGDRYLRRLYVIGAMAVLRRARAHPEKNPWLTQLLARKPPKVAAVALANKMARTAWALMARGETYRAPVVAGGSPVAALPVMAC